MINLSNGYHPNILMLNVIYAYNMDLWYLHPAIMHIINNALSKAYNKLLCAHNVLKKLFQRLKLYVLSVDKHNSKLKYQL